MADEKDGPYKVVISLTYAPANPTFSIVKEQSAGPFKTVVFKTVIPDAGEAQTARQVCNLLNKEQKRLDAEWLAQQKEEVANDEAQGSAG